jgi:5'(3')-deoxyribonucleotidase|nr:MAG TPA: 5' nucleotidase [Caudoviricetes sp.]
MKIVIDIDSTIIESIQMLVKIYNDHNPNNKLVYTRNHDWNLNPIVKDKAELGELFQYFDYEKFYDEKYLHFTYGALESINRLAKTGEHEIIFCSKHEESRKPVTSEFISKYFPNCKLMFVDRFEEKQAIPCDIIIDDKIECLSGAVANYAICFGYYEWNKNWDGVRCTNWNDIEDIITLLNIIDNK